MMGKCLLLHLQWEQNNQKEVLISGEKGYIQIDEYPRAQKATITYTADGHTEVIDEGDTWKSTSIEVMDMEEYINNNSGQENLQIVRDVMETLTSVRNQWGIGLRFWISKIM